MTNEEFRKRVLAYACPHCKVEAGKPCVAANGRKTALHSMRKDLLRSALFMWEKQKWMDCPHCDGKGRIKVVGGEE